MHPPSPVGFTIWATFSQAWRPTGALQLMRPPPRDNFAAGPAEDAATLDALAPSAAASNVAADSATLADSQVPGGGGDAKSPAAPPTWQARA
jgi:hypothetical protein